MYALMHAGRHTDTKGNIVHLCSAIIPKRAMRLTAPVLLLIDNQVGLDRPAPRSTPTYEENIPKLLSVFRKHRYPVFHLAHHSVLPASKLNRGIMAGAGIAFDRGMVVRENTRNKGNWVSKTLTFSPYLQRQHMKTLDKYFGHQIFDTSSVWVSKRSLPKFISENSCYDYAYGK